jgi:transposase
VGVVFCDVTTLYFEAERADDFRVPGFSKDGKTQNPQIVLGLLVGAQGTPLAYEIFKGNQFEGGTMIPVLKAFAKRFRLSKPIVVADAGLMSKDNIAETRAIGIPIHPRGSDQKYGPACVELGAEFAQG